MSTKQRLAALWTTIGLSLLFLVVYSGTNWISAHRSDVGTWYYDWEWHIPFVPWMIVPYASIDLFFLAAPFLCQSDTERRTLTRRIAFSILTAGACHLALPLTFAFGEPEVSGWPAPLFDLLRGFDQPYNLVPSLHIALRTILADLYTRHTRGALRWGLHAWFSLIGFSTLFTWQHHVIDVVAGFILAAVAFHLFRGLPHTMETTGNAKAGVAYTIGALVLVGLARWCWPWGGFLLWPALSLGLVATGYFGVGPGVFRKEHGGLPLSARLLCGPFLVGQRLSLAWYRRRARPHDVVAPGVWIGRQLTTSEAAVAVQQGVTAVVDLTGEFSEPAAFRRLTYFNLPVLDLTAPTPGQLAAAIEFIETERTRGIVYVHCKIGWSRSAAVVGAWLVASGMAADADAALAHLRQARPGIVIRPEAAAAVRATSRRALSASAASAASAASGAGT